MSGYINHTIQQEVYISEKRTDKDVFVYEYQKSSDGWWIKRSHHSIDSSFPERIEMWIPDEVIDHITAFNAKDKLS